MRGRYEPIQVTAHFGHGRMVASVLRHLGGEAS
jgi:hypothetical protein